MDFGILLGRLVLGLAMAAHGSQKLFGWFGGYGIAGTGAFFEGLGFRPGRFFAAAAGLGELIGGLLTALGLFGPVGPAIVILVMVVAMISVHAEHGFFASSNGVELTLVYVAAALILASSGPGAYSIDTFAGLSWSPELIWTVVGVALAGAFANLALRRRLVAAA